ncbi:chromate transporter [Spiroplasma endosymbiont of Tipula paludosa]|uniref:chromate transporter n=1 Tax=Spiroplasma endosymbiont of Tipula paludosa TaxID=3066295 RepID=UPI0035C88964
MFSCFSFKIIQIFTHLTKLYAPVVVKKRWITEDEFNHLLILANTIPGPSIFQVSASVGYKIAGITGALLASFVAYLPNMIAFIFLATLLFAELYL